MDEVVEAAKRAHAHKFVMQLPKGYDTVVGGSGQTLSQGQMQLLCIARVMLADPPILLLDEATSSIDTRTELQVQGAFDAMMENRTSLVVAHRLSTIRNADCILVMRDGRIVERDARRAARPRRLLRAAVPEPVCPVPRGGVALQTPLAFLPSANRNAAPHINDRIIGSVAQSGSMRTGGGARHGRSRMGCHRGRGGGVRLRHSARAIPAPGERPRGGGSGGRVLRDLQGQLRHRARWI